MVDEETRLDVAVASGETLIYKFTMVNTLVSEMDISYFCKKVEATVVANYCAMPNMRNMLNDGIKCQYMYFDRDSVYITEFIVTKDSCPE